MKKTYEVQVTGKGNVKHRKKRMKMKLGSDEKKTYEVQVTGKGNVKHRKKTIKKEEMNQERKANMLE